MTEVAANSAAPATSGVRIEELSAAGGRKVAIATLDAPKSLNSITLSMVRALDAALIRWQDDPSIACVLLHTDLDKVFSAGGNMRAIREAALAAPGVVPNPDALAFFGEEYRLDYRIHTYAKPIVCWGGGIVMGGGLGLMAGASHRIVTETTRIAMPEINIGLFPDVGGSWLFHRMPGRTGLFAGLTAAPLNAADALFTGLGDFALPQSDRAGLPQALAAIDWSDSDHANHVTLDLWLRARSDAAAVQLPEGEMRTHFDTIQRMTEGSDPLAIAARITGYGGESHWLQQAAKTLAKGSPTTAALVWTLWNLNQFASLADVLRTDLTVGVQCAAHHDFIEGVRAVLVDKDHAPRWQYPTLAEVPDALIEEHFVEPWKVHPLADL